MIPEVSNSFVRRCAFALTLAAFAPLLARADAPSAESKPSIKEKALSNSVSGVPIVLESGLLIVGGQKLVLWGIDTLAPDQQCWQGDSAWPCGEEATTALKHYVDGRFVECQILQRPEDAPVAARCFRQKEHLKKDIAEQLVKRGWALDHGETSGGAYFAAEEEANREKRGVWSGRFQTAKDWREGIQRFVGEPTAPDAKENDEDEDED